MRTTGAEWKRSPTGNPGASRWSAESERMTDGSYRVPTPAVYRPASVKRCWKSCGSTPSSAACDGSLGGVLNIFANSRSKSISVRATACRSSE